MCRCGYLKVLGGWISQQCQQSTANVLTHGLHDKRSRDKKNISLNYPLSCCNIFVYTQLYRVVNLPSLHAQGRSLFLGILLLITISLIKGHSKSCQTSSFFPYFDNFCASFWVPVIELEVKTYKKGRLYSEVNVATVRHPSFLLSDWVTQFGEF